VRVELEPLTQRPFDAYLVFITPSQSPLSVQNVNHFVDGLVPVVRNVPAEPKGYSGIVFEQIVPQGAQGNYMVLVGLVDRGKKVTGTGSAFLYDTAAITID